jgi:hypothetical protein
MRCRCLRIVAAALLIAGPAGCGSVGQGISLLPDRYPLGDQARAARICLPQDLPRELKKATIDAYRVEPGDGLLVVPHDLDTKIRLPADQTILADGTIDLGKYVSSTSPAKRCPRSRRWSRPL